ncbi:hypothetical protein KY329_03925 [Candidatus Woesearchaeota archaeon]|nr:hypothetical protein [Candidatus Woesearchaeota archaeon]
MTLFDTIKGMSTEEAQAYLDSLPAKRPKEVLAFGEEGEVLLHGDKVVKAFYECHEYYGPCDLDLMVKRIFKEACAVHARFPDHFVEPLRLEGADRPLANILLGHRYKERIAEYQQLLFPWEARRVWTREEFPMKERPIIETKPVTWNGPEGAVDPNVEIHRFKEQAYAFSPFTTRRPDSIPDVLRIGMDILGGLWRRRLKTYFRQKPVYLDQIWDAATSAMDVAIASIGGEREIRALASEFRKTGIQIAHPQWNYALVWVPEEEREKYPLVEGQGYRLGLDKTGENRIVFFEHYPF